MDSVDVLQLGMMNTDPTLYHPGAPNVEVSASHHFDGNPTPDIPACTGVRLPPLFGEAAGQVLQRGLRLCTYHAANIDEYHIKVALLMHTGVNLLALIVHFHL